MDTYFTVATANKRDKMGIFVIQLKEKRVPCFTITLHYKILAIGFWSTFLKIRLRKFPLIPSSQEVCYEYGLSYWILASLAFFIMTMFLLFSSFIQMFKNGLRDDNMARWVKMLVAKSDKLSLISGSHVVEGKNQFPQVVHWPPHECCGNGSPFQKKKLTKREQAQKK